MNGAPVSAPVSSAAPPVSPPPPEPEPPVVAAQAPTLDPNRPDFLSSLKSKQRPPIRLAGRVEARRVRSSSSCRRRVRIRSGDAPRAADAGASLFAEPGRHPPRLPPERAKSIFEPRARETVTARPETESVFARVASEPPPVAPVIEESRAALVAEPAEDLVTAPAEELITAAPEPPSVHPGQQAKIHALESFLRRVEHRRQQIESQSVA